MRLQVDRGTIDEFWKARYIEPDEDNILHREDDPVLIQRLIDGESSDAELPFPLDGARFYIASHGERIQYGFEINFDEDISFNKAANKFGEMLVTRKLNFYKTSPLFTGLIRDGDGEAIFDLVCGPNEDQPSRLISRGMYGSRIMRYKDVSNLATDILELSSITDTFINSCVNEYNSNAKKRKVKLPHMTLYLGIDITKR
jgi:hypothetical protein